MRFAQTGNRAESQSRVSSGTNEKTGNDKILKANDLYGTGGDGDSASIDIHFLDEKKSFLFDDQTMDNELKRKAGLTNGLINYSGKKTLNIETTDFSDLYYEVINS